MSVFSFFKERLSNKKHMESPEMQLYKDCVALNFLDIEKYKKYVYDFSQKIYEYRKSGYTNKHELFNEAMKNLNRYKYALYKTELTTDFIRPNTSEDIEYRKKQLTEFAVHLAEIIPEDSDLRFHGTPVYFAKEILKSGGILASADRFNGFMNSTDGKGEISVSDINSLSKTVNYYMDLQAFQRSLPCGCLFVLRADGQTEAQRKRSAMNNVDFKRNPEKLYAIVTTPENIPNIKELLKEAGLSQDIVFSFEEFTEDIEKKFSRQSERKSSLNDRISAADAIKTNINKEINTPVKGMAR